jgi:hypothetical protein
MAKLTARARAKLPAKDFAGPGRSFPMQDASHQRAAISGATRAQHAGNISAGKAASIKSQARAKLRQGK